MANRAASVDRRLSHHPIQGLRGNRPRYSRNVLWDTANHFALEVFDNLWPSLIPPHLGRRDFLAILQGQHLRQVGKGIGLGRIIIRGVRRIGPATGTGSQANDSQLLHHVSVIFLGRPSVIYWGFGRTILRGQIPDELGD